MGDLVTDLVSQSLRVLLLLTYKEEPWRLVTFETLDQIDEETWPDKHFDKLDFVVVDNFDNFLVLFEIFHNVTTLTMLKKKKLQSFTIFDNFNQ